MSSRSREESFLLGSRGDLIERLIYQSLHDEVEGIEPSPQVWENICQRIVATDVSSQGRDAKAWVPLLLDSALALFNVFFSSSDWEAQLVKHQSPVLWFMPFSSSLAWAV